ncbi:MAG TPA: hypothetical protein VL691_21700 [Vicinamibacteria bacterium]|nr:hypothetical protein [Vicinamibacteria bacterium]
MSGSRRCPARAPVAVLLALAVLFGTAGAEAHEPAVTNARLRRPQDRALLAETIRGAARRLGDPRCQVLLGEFADAKHRPLREALEAEGLSAPQFLGRLYFYDGSDRGCGARRLAYTTPGSRVVYVCGDRLRDVYFRNTTLAEVAVVHETLHCLGLGENPPTWKEINDRIQAVCRH